MNFKTLSVKVTGGLFALVVVGAAVSAKAPVASADPCPSPPCFTQYEPGGIVNALRPDLTIQQFTVSRISPNAVRLTAVIKNQGGGVAHAGFATLLSVDGLAEKLWIEQALAPGATRMMTYDFNVPLTTMTHLAGLRVDDGLIVAEQLENNNYKTVSFK
jgi:hypothetical protein